MSARFVVMVSGGGTNLQALIDAISSGMVNARISLVVSSRKDAFALERARNAGLAAMEATPPRLSPAAGPADDSARKAARRAYDRSLADSIRPLEPDYIFLLGWMRILTADFIDSFPGRIVNLHPALPGTFPGANAIERAWEAHERGEITKTGVMTHYVPDARVDAGPVISQKTVDFLSGESFGDFEARMHRAERQLVVETASSLADMAAKGEKR